MVKIFWYSYQKRNNQMSVFIILFTLIVMSAAPNQWFLFVKNRILQESQKTVTALFWANSQNFFFILKNYEFADPYSPFNCQESPTIEP